jgi:hypothetical protein
VAGGWSIGLLIIILPLWLVEADVFQIPQLHKHFNVSGNYDPYPFTPKSNSKLKRGQFWTIKLSNGRFAAGVVLDIPAKEVADTKTFFAGLLNWVGASKPTKAELESSKIEVVEQGVAHIKTITGDGEQIEGEVDLEKCAVSIRPEVDSIAYSKYSQILKGFQIIGKALPVDHERCKTRSTWGYKMIINKANRLLRQE